MDVAHFPGNQDANEEHDGEANAKSQGLDHVAFGRNGFIGTLRGVFDATAHHVKEGGGQAGQNGQERKCNNYFHERNYRMSWKALTSALKKNTGFQSVLWLSLAIVGVAIACQLGFWQLGRAQTKLDWQAEMTKKAQMPVLEGSFLGGAQDSEANRVVLQHRPIQLEGEWLSQHTVYLDNRQMNARPGFYVLTPLKVQGTGAVVLVQRGWVGRDFTDRTRLPAIQTPAGPVTLSGLIALPPSKLYALGEEAKTVIRQNLDLKDFRVETGLPLLEISVIQTGAASEGLLREWPQAATGVEKHHGYAFQWFGLALLIALLYVWFQIVRPRIKSKVIDSH